MNFQSIISFPKVLQKRYKWKKSYASTTDHLRKHPKYLTELCGQQISIASPCPNIAPSAQIQIYSCPYYLHMCYDWQIFFSSYLWNKCTTWTQASFPTRIIFHEMNTSPTRYTKKYCTAMCFLNTCSRIHLLLWSHSCANDSLPVCLPFPSWCFSVSDWQR